MDRIITALGWIEPEQCVSYNDAMMPEWDVEDQQMVIQYLVAMFVLAKYKGYCKLSSNKGTVVRLQPKNAAAYGSQLISPFWDRSNYQYKDVGSNRLDVRFASLQKWVSALSCSWVQAWAEKLSFSAAAHG
jgi:hypothetical protein